MSILDRLVEEYKNDIEYKHEIITHRLTEDLVYAMDEKGWNRKRLAEELKVSPAYITKFLNGMNPTIKQVIRIFSALDRDVDIKIKKSNKAGLKIICSQRANHPEFWQSHDRTIRYFNNTVSPEKNTAQQDTLGEAA